MTQDSESLDIDFEPEDELGSLGAMKAKMQKLRVELEHVKTERQEYLDGWQRCKADSMNARKETLYAAEQSANRIKESILHDLLPALDSFDLATGAESWQSVSDGWRSGMEHVRNQLIEALRGNGIEQFASAGDAYDPVAHDVVEERDDVAGDIGTIVRVLRHGYKTGDKVLRAAQVILKK